MLILIQKKRKRDKKNKGLSPACHRCLLLLLLSFWFIRWCVCASVSMFVIPHSFSSAVTSCLPSDWVTHCHFRTWVLSFFCLHLFIHGVASSSLLASVCSCSPQRTFVIITSHPTHPFDSKPPSLTIFTEGQVVVTLIMKVDRCTHLSLVPCPLSFYLSLFCFV